MRWACLDLSLTIVFEYWMGHLVMFRLTVDSFLLNFWQVSFEDEKDRQNRIAKMRSLLFRHEMKAKHIKKIKSKTYHRLLKKDRVKGASAHIEMDPDAAKELAMKQEFKRAEVIICTVIFL